MRPCYMFAAGKAEGEPETLSIYDEIGFWGVQAKDFRTSLANVKSSILNVEINSPGGDVFAGVAIYNMLKSSGKEIVVKVMGVAASAASLIAMAGDKRVMPKNTMMMIHNPWSFAMGNADELRDTADTLDKIGASLLGTYMSATGLDEAKIKAMLATDTWMTADEAMEMGFATEITDEVKVSAKFDLARAELPSKVRASLGLPPADPVDPPADPADPPPADPPADPVDPPAADPAPIAEQITALAKAAGLEVYAATFALKCGTVADAQARIGVAREINALCASIKMPDAAAAFINEGKTVAEARASMIEIMAKQDKHIDTTPPRADGKKTTSTSGKKPVTTASLWDSHNKQSAKKGS